MSAKAETLGAGVEKMKISADRDNLITKNIPWDLTKKMNTHTLCFCPLIRKLQAFEILKWAKESQWTKQRTSNFTREFHCSENKTFYIFTAVKCSFLNMHFI